MNVCVWSSSSFEEWYSSYHLMLKIIQEIISAGHEVWLVQVQRSTGKIPAELEGEHRLHIINIKQSAARKENFALRYIKGFQYFRESGRKIAELEGIDVIFLQSNNNAIVPINIARKLGIPIVYNVQDVFPEDAMVVGKLSKNHPAYVIARMLQSVAYKRATRVITISEDLKQTIRKHGRQDVEVIYNWSYQNAAYNITDENNHFLRTNRVSREDGFRVIYAGNVGQMVDCEMIVRTAKILAEEEEIKVYIIGEGSGLETLKIRVSEEKLQNVLFFGRQPMEYAQDNYCAADININPVPKGVIYTCMPSKTATCLLSEKPTVVSMDLESDMARKLSSVDQWTVVEPGDYRAMADAVLKVYRNGSCKSRNASTFLKNLGPVENARKYVAIMEDVANSYSKKIKNIR